MVKVEIGLSSEQKRSPGSTGDLAKAGNENLI